MRGARVQGSLETRHKVRLSKESGREQSSILGGTARRATDRHYYGPTFRSGP